MDEGMSVPEPSINLMNASSSPPFFIHKTHIVTRTLNGTTLCTGQVAALNEALHSSITSSGGRQCGAGPLLLPPAPPPWVPLAVVAAAALRLARTSWGLCMCVCVCVTAMEGLRSIIIVVASHVLLCV